jgi:hypothetical protein
VEEEEEEVLPFCAQLVANGLRVSARRDSLRLERAIGRWSSNQLDKRCMMLLRRRRLAGGVRAQDFLAGVLFAGGYSSVLAGGGLGGGGWFSKKKSNGSRPNTGELK